MKLYFKYLSLQLKSAFEYRLSLILSMFSSSLSTLANFIAIVLLFSSFETIAGYSLSEVLITYSMVSFSFSFSEGLFRGFDQFDTLVKTGELDRLFIRPRSIFMQVLGYKVEFNKLGRVILSGILLVYALLSATIVWTAFKVVVLLLMIIASMVIFLGLFLVYSGISIFTIEGLEAVNIVTNGGRDLCYYPIDIYPKVFRRVFTYIVPFAVFNYIPLQYLLGYPNATLFYAISPLFSFVFLGICYLFFRWALTKYKSSGS